MSARPLRISAAVLVCCLAGFAVPGDLRAGTPGDSTYSLVAYIGGGLARYIVAPGGPPPGVPVEYTRTGLSGTVRVMWHPDHLLRLGLESGWASFYSYKFGTQPSGEVSLSAVPLLVVWSMNVLGVDWFVGSGYYRLNSSLDFKGTVDVQTWSLGWMAAASYTHPLSESLGLAGEVKWMNATEHADAALNIQVQLVWKLLEW